jgi:hypothetical protein
MVLANPIHVTDRKTAQSKTGPEMRIPKKNHGGGRGALDTLKQTLEPKRLKEKKGNVVHNTARTSGFFPLCNVGIGIVTTGRALF